MGGRFYPGDPAACRAAARELVHLEPSISVDVSSARGWGAIVPHAGWMCSGAVAGQALAELSRLNQGEPPSLVVVFGAVHTPISLDRAALDSHRLWQVPGGQTATASDLAEQLSAAATGLFVQDDRFHRQEHAVEVELPLIQALWPDAELLPIEVPLIDRAVQIGRETAQRVLSTWRRTVFLASSDLTHYGPNYRFTPAGVGLEAIGWAKQNDGRLLRLIAEYATDRIVPEVREHANACGGGAIAAMLAACSEAGASRATLLRHTNSYETLAGKAPDDPSNAVGYAGVVVS